MELNLIFAFNPSAGSQSKAGPQALIEHSVQMRLNIGLDFRKFPSEGDAKMCMFLTAAQAWIHSALHTPPPPGALSK